MIDIAQYGWLGILFALFIGHAIADYPLQHEFMAQAKQPKYWKEVKSSKGFEWVFVLAFHCFIHGGAVWLLTESLLLGLIETVLHFLIDVARNQERICFISDQLLHLGCKVGYLIFLFA